MQLSFPSPQHQLFMELLPHPASNYTVMLQAQHPYLPMQKAGPNLLCTVYLVLPHLNLSWIGSWHTLGAATAIAMPYLCLSQGSLLYWWYPPAYKKRQIKYGKSFAGFAQHQNIQLPFHPFSYTRQRHGNKRGLVLYSRLSPEPPWTGSGGFSFCFSGSYLKFV